MGRQLAHDRRHPLSRDEAVRAGRVRQAPRLREALPVRARAVAALQPSGPAIRSGLRPGGNVGTDEAPAASALGTRLAWAALRGARAVARRSATSVRGLRRP